MSLTDVYCPPLGIEREYNGLLSADVISVWLKSGWVSPTMFDILKLLPLGMICYVG